MQSISPVPRGPTKLIETKEDIHMTSWTRVLCSLKLLRVANGKDQRPGKSRGRRSIRKQKATTCILYCCLCYLQRTPTYTECSWQIEKLPLMFCEKDYGGRKTCTVVFLESFLWNISTKSNGKVIQYGWMRLVLMILSDPSVWVMSFFRIHLS